MTEHEQQLMTLRALTSTTGVVHDAQLLQLKMWGGIAFTVKWECDVNIATHTVTYELKKKQKHDPKVIASLDNSVHWLLGDEWTLQVLEKKKVLYSGPRLKDKSEEINEQRQQRAGDPKGGHTS